jgi:hypothetical protein
MPLEKDPAFIAVLTSRLEEDESVKVCRKCGCTFISHFYYREDDCIVCSGKRTSYGEAARETIEVMDASIRGINISECMNTVPQSALTRKVMAI